MTALRCWMMGWGALLVACGDAARARGHEVTGVVTRYGPAVDWAAAHGIPAAPALAGLRDRVSRPDLLVSVNNDVVLDPEDLAVSRLRPINLHSSPLPRYAGVHQTTWALLNGETSHGVTWHEMVAEVDAGPVLRAATFPVLPEDTTLSLDIRCYDHGLDLFGPLLDDLAAGTATRRAQDLSARTYHPARRLFPGAGLVSWRQPAEELDRWCRAGQFGQLDNRFGQPRVLVGDTLLVLRGLRRTSRSGGAPPGTVLALDAGRVLVATGSTDVELHEVAGPDGHRLTAGEALSALDLGVGATLPELEPDRRDRIAERLAAAAAAEPGWLDVLEAARSWPAPRHPLWLPRPGAPDRATALLDRRAAAEVATRLDRRRAAVLLAAWLVVLDGHGTARFSDDRRRAAAAGAECVVARDVPVPVRPAGSATFAAACAAVERWLIEQSGRAGYPRDLPGRYPLHGVARRALPVSLAVTERAATVEPAPDTAVTIGLDTRRLTCQVTATDHLGPARDTARRFAALGAQANRVLATAAEDPYTTVEELRPRPVADVRS